MPTMKDINEKRDAALQLLLQKLNAANKLRNEGALGLNETIQSLRDQRAAVAAQAYEAGLNDQAMKAALETLKAATSEMNSVAAKMVSPTTFITNVASLGTATNKVVSALKGSGGTGST